jgi:DNA-binding transcriptional LysR family regulator
MVEISTTGMRVLREVARQGSFSAAAEALGYTQSAISRQVALAEGVAGRELFRRHSRGVEPTSAGKVVLRHASAALAELEAARNELDDLASRRLSVCGSGRSRRRWRRSCLRRPQRSIVTRTRSS